MVHGKRLCSIKLFRLVESKWQILMLPALRGGCLKGWLFALFSHCGQVLSCGRIVDVTFYYDAY